MKEIWWRLFEALLSKAFSHFPNDITCNSSMFGVEPDVLQFPVSLLTAAALVDSTQVCLVRKYEYQAKWNAEMARRHRPGSGSSLKQAAGVESKVQAKRGKEGSARGRGCCAGYSSSVEDF